MSQHKRRLSSGSGPPSKLKSKAEKVKSIRSLNDWDVLMGRGSSINKRPGNVRFREYVETLREEYATADRKEKILFSRRVVQKISSNGGRFVKFLGDPEEEVFVEIPVQRAVEKCCQALRESRWVASASNDSVKSAGSTKKGAKRKSTGSVESTGSTKKGVKSGQASKRNVSTGVNSLSKKSSKKVGKRPSSVVSSVAAAGVNSLSKKSSSKKPEKRPSSVVISATVRKKPEKRPSSVVVSSADVSRKAKKPRKTLSRQGSMSSVVVEANTTKGIKSSSSLGQTDSRRKNVANSGHPAEKEVGRHQKDAGQFKDAKLLPRRVEHLPAKLPAKLPPRRVEHPAAADESGSETLSVSDEDDYYYGGDVGDSDEEDDEMDTASLVDKHYPSHTLHKKPSVLQHSASRQSQMSDVTSGQAQAPPTHRLLMENPLPPTHRLLTQDPPAPLHRLMAQNPPAPMHRLMAQNPPAPMHRLMVQNPLPTNSPQRPSSTSGWFCDFMNGGSSESSATSYWEELFLALVHFKEVHGHCAVPPTAGSPHAGSSKEEKNHARLADWASVQRQIFRQIESGRRVATDEEKNRRNRLKALGFVFDYDEWLWQRRYDELVKFQEAPDDGEDISSLLGLAVWVKEQRLLYLQGLQGKIQAMREDRVKKLEKINFSWAIDAQLPRKAPASKVVPHKKKGLPGKVGDPDNSDAVKIDSKAFTANKSSSELANRVAPETSAAPNNESTESVNKVATEKLATPKNDSTEPVNKVADNSATPNNDSAAPAKSVASKPDAVNLQFKLSNQTFAAAVTPAPRASVHLSASKDFTPASSKDDKGTLSNSEGVSNNTTIASAHTMVSPEPLALTKGAVESGVAQHAVPKASHPSNGSSSSHTSSPLVSTASLQASTVTGETKDLDLSYSSSKNVTLGAEKTILQQEGRDLDMMEAENIRPTQSTEIALAQS